MPCLIKSDMHHICLCIMTCLCVFTMLFASFRFASLVSFGFVPELWGFVRLRAFVFFMDSFFFLAGFQARWPLPLISLLSLLASCSVLSLCCAIYHLFYQASQIAMSASNIFTLPSKPLLGYVTALVRPSYSVASCRWSWRFLHGGQDYDWDITISLILLMHLYTW